MQDLEDLPNEIWKQLIILNQIKNIYIKSLEIIVIGQQYQFSYMNTF